MNINDDPMITILNYDNDTFYIYYILTITKKIITN